MLFLFTFIANASNDTEVKTFETNFSAYDDVSNAFAKLFSISREVINKVSSEKFAIIKARCLAVAGEPLCSLIKRATDTHCFFEILAVNNNYCNWMDVTLLEIIAIACGNKNLQSLIQNYKEVIYSKSLREVWSHISHSVRDKYCIGDKDPGNITVKELIDSNLQLAREVSMRVGG